MHALLKLRVCWKTAQRETKSVQIQKLFKSHLQKHAKPQSPALSVTGIRRNTLGEKRDFLSSHILPANSDLYSTNLTSVTETLENLCTNKDDINNSFSNRLLRTSTPKDIYNNTNYKSITFGLLNARSMVRKSTLICYLVISHRLDILALTETWLKGTEFDNPTIAHLQTTLPNYFFHHIPRKNRRGGGVGFLIRDKFTSQRNHRFETSSFEYQDINVFSNNGSIRLLVIYRPPSSKVSSRSVLHEFSLLLEDVSLTPHPIVISGDFNYHVDDSSNSDASAFLDILESADLVQNVTGSTHRSGRTLDLIISRDYNNIVSNVRVYRPDISDHGLIICSLRCPIHPPKARVQNI